MLWLISALAQFETTFMNCIIVINFQGSSYGLQKPIHPMFVHNLTRTVTPSFQNYLVLYQFFFHRLNAIAESKSSELTDIGNPYPPPKLAEMYTELFKKEWKDVLEIQRKSHGRNENDAIIRLAGLLKVTYI